MSLPRLDNPAARAIFLDRHALAEAPSGPAKGADLLDLITRLGFVQLDSVNTVARAHDLILFARRPRYRPADLRRLYEQDRALFEHWTHDASVIPMAFFPWWRMRMQRDAAALVRRWRNWQRHDFEAKLQDVLDHIRDEGPCCSSDVGPQENKGSGGWWDWHPSKTALEYLWRSGVLTVVGREGFRKRYDLTERVIESAMRNDVPSEAETIDWCMTGALDRLGFATSGELAAFWAHVTAAEAQGWCAAALARGEIIEIAVEGANGIARRAFARPDLPEAPVPEIEATTRLRVLSPFDPALRDRKRAKRLFGFDYRVEMFVPESQRRYGYYVFPVLQEGRIVARVDMKAFRDRDTLEIRALWPEPGVHWGKARSTGFEAELERIKRLAGVSRVDLGTDTLRPAPPA